MFLSTTSPTDSVKIEILVGQPPVNVHVNDTSWINALPPYCIERKLLFLELVE